MHTSAHAVCERCAYIIDYHALDEFDHAPGTRETIRRFLNSLPADTTVDHDDDSGRGYWQDCECCQQRVLNTVTVTSTTPTDPDKETHDLPYRPR